MGRLTPEERRRMFFAQQQARREMLARMTAPIVSVEGRAPRDWLRQALKTAMIVALLGGGWFAYHAVEFHVPTSVVETLLPRL